jgi:ketosteroid isomerase-like protein
MSQENVDVVKRTLDAFNRRNLDAWLAGWDAQCEYQPAMERDMAGDDDGFRGHQGLRRWWQQMSDAWSYSHSEVHDIRPVADRVLASVTFRATGRASGAEMDASFFLVGTIRSGKILSSRDYADRAEALKAVGLEK